MANILVFDSGMGGLTVYGESRRALPAHNYFHSFTLLYTSDAADDMQ
mgnify:CR=1 FL=1